MKKAFVLFLALVLALSLAVPAYAAVTSSEAETQSGTSTAPLPFLISDTSNEDAAEKCVLIPVEDAAKLTEEEQAIFAEAQAALAEAKPADMRAQYFFYYKPGSNADAENGSTLVVNIRHITRVVVKQFVDGKWIPLKAYINPDGTVTIEGVVEGPIAIFTL